MRLAFRQLTKAPGFTALVILTLALGIGVNAAAFSFVRDMLITPRAQHARQNLVALYTARVGPNPDFRRFSYSELTTLRDAPEVFRELTGFTLEMAAIGRGDELKRSLLSGVLENYFATFGLHPHAGRFFTAAETEPGADIPVVVANHTFWQRLGGRPDFVGSEIRINQRTFTVVGIAPQGFGSVNATLGPDLWLPLGALQSLFGTDLRSPRTRSLYLVGSLHPDLSLDAARARIPSLDARLNALQLDEDPRTLLLERPGLFNLGATRPEDESHVTLFSLLTLGLALTVLIVACLNLANMLLARGTERRKEIAIRLALGASRGRVIRQLLLEGLVLALAGGTAGLLLAVWTGDLLLEWAQSAFAASPFAMTIQPAIDPTLLIASALLSGLATLLFSLIPALRSTRVDLVSDLKQQAGAPSQAGSWGRFFSLRHTLLMGQIALSLMLLFSAGLFLRGARAAKGGDHGFSTDRQLTANLEYSLAGLTPDDTTRRQLHVLNEVKNRTGVSAAALASSVPFNFELHFRPVSAADGGTLDQGRPAATHHAGFTAVSRGYFGTLGIPLLRGRDFTAAESHDSASRPVAIIDESLASALFSETDPLGRHVLLNSAADRPIEIVGIVRSPRDDVFAQHAPRRIYRPLAQAPAGNIYLHLQLAEGLDSATAVNFWRQELQAIDSAPLLLSVRPLADYLTKNINLLLIRLAGSGFTGFALIAILLAVVGVYGLKAYTVAQRRREIGIRLALGAQMADIVSLFLRQGAAQIAVAVSVGILLALLAGQALSKMLYRVNAFDSTLLAAAALLVATVALLACWLPARRATKVDPLAALRAE